MKLEFSTLFNNIMSNQAPGLNDYEISVFLTKAQDEVVKNRVSARSRGNVLQLGFDDSQKRQIDFSGLVRTVSPSAYTGAITKIDSRSTAYGLPQGILVLLNETVSITGNTTPLQIVPLGFDEYTRLMNKPYKYPLKNQAWRLMNSVANNGNKVVEIIVGPSSTISAYTIRYVTQPTPIVISDLPSGLPLGLFDGEGNKITTATPCALDPELHEDIVQRAVELAKAAWSSNDTLVTLGQRTE